MKSQLAFKLPSFVFMPEEQLPCISNREITRNEIRIILAAVNSLIFVCLLGFPFLYSNALLSTGDTND